jgi:predicted transposase YbfD/YdcC
LCQQAIVSKIREKGADYVIAVKDNQPTLAHDVCLYFDAQDKKTDVWGEANYHETVEKGHGRVEVRRYYGIDISNWKMSPGWTDLNSIIRVKSSRYIKGIEENETRYYIASSNMARIKKAFVAVRQHWAVENNLHWQLDVSFNEDEWRAKAGNITTNIALLNKFALNLVKKETSRKASMKSKRFATALSDDYMELVIFNHANCIR